MSKNDYSKTIIYKLFCNDPNTSHCYVGHTTNFQKRLRDHKANTNFQNSKKYNYKLYKTIRENGNFENWTMEPIEECCCANRREAIIKEREWYDKLQANLNTQVPNQPKSVTTKKWKDNNPEKIKEYMKTYNSKYQEKNYEYLNTKHNCDCGGTYTNKNKSTHIKTFKHYEYLVKNKLITI